MSDNRFFDKLRGVPEIEVTDLIDEFCRSVHRFLRRHIKECCIISQGPVRHETENNWGYHYSTVLVLRGMKTVPLFEMIKWGEEERYEITFQYTDSDVESIEVRYFKDVESELLALAIRVVENFQRKHII